jgi:hydrogenase maturation protein HypF
MAEHMALVRVQHHHAHLCAVLVEHGIEPGAAVTGIILDGMGYGPDGTVWGGEVLEGGYHTYRRVGHLRCIPQPGGDQGAIEPARMATSLLTDAGMQDKAPSVFDERIARICGIREVSPLTSSTGRLFDGVAALLGVAPRRQSYEGEAASILEAVADLCCADAYPLPAQGEELDTRVLIAALMEDSAPVPIRAARFHNGLADGLASMALSAGNETIVLGGGCMVNRLLLHRLKGRLEEAGAVVKQPVQLPAGDGGLSAGQAAVAACTVGQQKAAR